MHLHVKEYFTLVPFESIPAGCANHFKGQLGVLEERKKPLGKGLEARPTVS